ncbi:hypothetical protein HOY80DRAFT_990014, partial [Tuber brumale]
MQRTCLACVEHARHVQNMFGMFASFRPHPFPYPLLYRLFAVRIRFAVRCAQSTRQFIVQSFPITVSYFPSPDATYHSPIPYPLPITVPCSQFVIRRPPFAGCRVLPTSRRPFPVIAGKKVRDCRGAGGGAGAGAVGNGTIGMLLGSGSFSGFVFLLLA